MKRWVGIRYAMGILCLLIGLSGCGKADTMVKKENDANVILENVEEDTRPSIQEKIALVESVREPALSEEAVRSLEVQKNPFPNLNVPTDVQYIENTYFIVDCYNNQVIYSDEIEKPLTEWNVMCDIMHEGHTIASNGEVYLIDDTENNRVLVYEKNQDKFLLVQALNHVGERPHYVRYEEKTDAFYVLSSMTGEIYVLKTREMNPVYKEENGNENGAHIGAEDENTVEKSSTEIYVEDIKRFDELADTYCRSFTILGEKIFLPASNGLILEASFPACEVSATYQAPKEVAGLVQLYVIEDSYYFTVSTDGEGNQDYATLISARDLSQLENGEYEDLYDVLEPERGSTGTPYNISAFEGHYYLVEHRHGHGLFQFDGTDNGIENVKILQ